MSGLPMALSVGAWLLQQAGWSGPVRAYELDDARNWPTNGEDGVNLAGWADRVGLLVMGSGPVRASADGQLVSALLSDGGLVVVGGEGGDTARGGVEADDA